MAQLLVSITWTISQLRDLTSHDLQLAEEANLHPSRRQGNEHSANFMASVTSASTPSSLPGNSVIPPEGLHACSFLSVSELLNIKLIKTQTTET